MMINSFLHMQASSYTTTNISFSTHLHSVVAHFASLGPVARLYLLKTRTLGRLLRLLLTYNNSAQLPGNSADEMNFMYDKMPLYEISYTAPDHDPGNNNISTNEEQKKNH